MDKPTCNVATCDKPSRNAGPGYCSMHYTRLHKTGSLELPTATERFWQKVEISPGCWLWTAGKSGSGYGCHTVDGGPVSAHRFSYELAYGPIADGMHIDHTCHNNDLTCSGGPCRHRACVNPSHLEAVWPGENLRRSHLTLNGMNSRRELCPQGHDYTWTVRADGKAYRWCRPCKQQRELENAARINAWRRNRYAKRRALGMSRAEAK